MARKIKTFFKGSLDKDQDYQNQEQETLPYTLAGDLKFPVKQGGQLVEQHEQKSQFIYTIRHQNLAVPAGASYVFTFGDLTLYKPCRLIKLILNGYKSSYAEVGIDLTVSLQSGYLGDTPYASSLPAGSELVGGVVMNKSTGQALTLDFGQGYFIQGNAVLQISAIAYANFVLNDDFYAYLTLIFE
jgi:hypothetical protein